MRQSLAFIKRRVPGAYGSILQERQVSSGNSCKDALLTTSRVIHPSDPPQRLKPMCESTPNDDDFQKHKDEIDEQLASLEGSQFEEQSKRPLQSEGAGADQRKPTVTDQTIAAVLGFLTAGPIGALASWGSIRGFQGRWVPWIFIGVPAAVVINIFNLIALGFLIGGDESPVVSPADPSPSVSQSKTEVGPPSSLPAYNESNSGGSTLVEKCQAIVAAQNADNLFRVAQLSFQVGFEHDTPWNSDVDEDCESVGVTTR